MIGRETNTSYNRPCSSGGTGGGGGGGGGGGSKSSVDSISLLERIQDRLSL